jgi:hypothetical protein
LVTFANNKIEYDMTIEEMNTFLDEKTVSNIPSALVREYAIGLLDGEFNSRYFNGEYTHIDEAFEWGVNSTDEGDLWCDLSMASSKVELTAALNALEIHIGVLTKPKLGDSVFVQDEGDTEWKPRKFVGDGGELGFMAAFDAIGDGMKVYFWDRMRTEVEHETITIREEEEEDGFTTRQSYNG